MSDKPDIMELAKEPYLGCGNNPCFVEQPRGGMHTNGKCRCFEDIPDPKKRMRVRQGVMRQQRQLRAALEELARTKEELEGLRKDRERLDWLEINGFQATALFGDWFGEITSHWGIVRNTNEFPSQFKGKTIREAIDSALRSASAKEGE